MPSIINASSSGSGGIVQTADASGVLQLQNNGTVGLTMTSGSVDLPVAGAILTLNRGQYSQQTKFYQDTGGTGAIYETTNPSVNAQYYAHVFKGTNNAPTTVEYGKFNQWGLGLGGASPSSGTGVTFPAVQSASSDANTLDDYEEGTFLPTITGDTGPSSITYTSQVGRYIKIGNVVNVWIYIQIGTISGGTGSAFISNLPFTVGAGVQGGIYNNWSNSGTTSLFPFAGHIPVSQARAYLVYVTGGATTQLPVSQIIASTQLIMSGSYTLQS